MSRCWRAYDEAVDDPKVQTLPDAIFKAWFNLCCLNSANGGVLPAFEAIAFKLRMSNAKAKAIVEKLKDVNLIDETDGVFKMHNWDGRQYRGDVTDPTNASRQKRYRERQRNVTSNTVTTVTDGVTAKRPDTEADTEPEAEKNSSLLPSPIESKNLSIGEAKREVSPPRHCAQNREKTRVYIVKGTPEWDAYAEDYRAATGEEPNTNSNGGKWFKTQGQSSSDGLDIPEYLRRA